MSYSCALFLLERRSVLIGNRPDTAGSILIEVSPLDQAQANEVQPELPSDRAEVQVLEVGGEQIVFKLASHRVDDVAVRRLERVC